MPLRGLKHFVPYFRQTESVYGMIKFCLQTLQAQQRMCPVLAHSAISGRPKKQFLDFPRGKKGLCHSIKQLYSNQPDVISVWGRSL